MNKLEKGRKQLAEEIIKWAKNRERNRKGFYAVLIKKLQKEAEEK